VSAKGEEQLDFDFDAYVHHQVEKQAQIPPYQGKRSLDFTPFQRALDGLTGGQIETLTELLTEPTLAAIQSHFTAGVLTAEALTLYTLYRIRTFDADKLNSVLTLNPDALTIAQSLDRERLAGKHRGPLHGVPVLLKDNVATGDQMPNAAGSIALAHARADRDSFVASRLRAAGAVLIGKANLSEWANFMTSTSNNGFSALGGQTRNPYGAFDVGGSSSGSAVAVAADLVPLAVGSETSGSISYPASQNAVVGIKPSYGLVSRDRVIPITAAMDTLGPMARTVADAVILLNAMAGLDPQDQATQDAASLHGVDFTRFLRADALTGVRVGMCKSTKEIRRGDRAVFERIETVLRRAGAILVDIPFPDEPGIDYRNILHYGMKQDLNSYLRATHAPIQDLAGIIAFNAEDLPNRAPYGQDLLEKSEQLSVTAEQYEAEAAENRNKGRALLQQLMAAHDVALFVSLANYLAPVYAPAGCPLITVPAGFREDGEPIGAAFVGAHLSEPVLIGAAYAYEQHESLRRPPRL
jgi:amidase